MSVVGASSAVRFLCLVACVSGCSSGSATRPDFTREGEPALADDASTEPSEPPEPPAPRADAGGSSRRDDDAGDVDASDSSAPEDAGDSDADSDAGLELDAGVVLDAARDGGASVSDAAPTTTNYTNDIAPILRQHCVLCHFSGGPAPFPLSDFSEVSQYTDEIRRVTADREMPPCDEGSAGCGLSEAQIALIGRWVQAGAPR